MPARKPQPVYRKAPSPARAVGKRVRPELRAFLDGYAMLLADVILTPPPPGDATSTHAKIERP